MHHGGKYFENNEQWQVQTRSVRATRRFARRLGAVLQPGAVVALTGGLGAGKTSFVQGLAEGLGVADTTQVISPTYTLVNEYEASSGLLVHIDFYRLDDVDAAQALGLPEMIGRKDAVTAVEWADKFPELLPPETVWIDIQHLGAGVRQLHVRGIKRI